MISNWFECFQNLFKTFPKCFKKPLRNTFTNVSKMFQKTFKNASKTFPKSLSEWMNEYLPLFPFWPCAASEDTAHPTEWGNDTSTSIQQGVFWLALCTSGHPSLSPWWFGEVPKDLQFYAGIPRLSHRDGLYYRNPLVWASQVIRWKRTEIKQYNISKSFRKWIDSKPKSNES